jgi:hypothetical protein
MSNREGMFSVNVVITICLIAWGVVLLCAGAGHAG